MSVLRVAVTFIVEISGYAPGEYENMTNEEVKDIIEQQGAISFLDPDDGYTVKKLAVISEFDSP